MGALHHTWCLGKMPIRPLCKRARQKRPIIPQKSSHLGVGVLILNRESSAKNVFQSKDVPRKPLYVSYHNSARRMKKWDVGKWEEAIFCQTQGLGTPFIFGGFENRWVGHGSDIIRGCFWKGVRRAVPCRCPVSVLSNSEPRLVLDAVLRAVFEFSVASRRPLLPLVENQILCGRPIWFSSHQISTQMVFCYTISPELNTVF